MKLCIVGTYTVYSYKGPMEYLRSLLPIGYPPAPPSSLRTVSPRGRGSECSTSDCLSPPASENDDNEPALFSPLHDDNINLNQVEMETSSNTAAESSSMHTTRSIDSLRERSSIRPRSHPSTLPSSPHAEHTPSYIQSPRRRSSMPASAFKRTDKLLTTPHDGSPSVRFTLDCENISQEGILDTSPSPMENLTITTDASFHFENFDANLTPEEQPDTPESPASLVGTDVSIEDQHFLSADELEHHIGAEDMTTETALPQLDRADIDPGSQVSLEPDKTYHITSRRKSLPNSLKGHESTEAKLPGIRKSRTHRLLSVPKSLVTGAAITHTYVHNFLTGEDEDDEPSVPASSYRRLSATKQIVQSKDSTYEVIWEDIVGPSTVAVQAATVLSNTSSLSPDASRPGTPAPGSADAMVSDLDRVDVKLTAWSWTSEKGVLHSHPDPRLISSVYTDSNLSSYMVGTRQDDTHTATPCVPTAIVEEDADATAAGPWIKATPAAVEEAAGLDSRSGDPDVSQAYAAMLTSEPEMEIHESHPERRPRSMSNTSQKRRELLGNRKDSNLPPDDKFASHRDSLLLAHMRISHDSPGNKPQDDFVRGHLNPHLGQLKQSTWAQAKADWVLDSPVVQTPKGRDDGHT